MADEKTIFVAFAKEDERQRDLLKGQSLNTDSPFEYVDMSVKEPYNTGWKSKVRTRIRRSDGVIALVSESTSSSDGETWEIDCAKEEGKSLVGLWAYTDDQSRPSILNGKRIIRWTWPNIKDFINRL